MKKTIYWPISIATYFCVISFNASAADAPTLDTIDVETNFENLTGTAESANQGTINKKQLDARTVYRPGELLETTPGLIVTQHSGEGKAGQYYLRGFNLDHGTDMRTTVDGMIVNERSHGHGQGWTDLNFIIPEIADNLQYKKGPYYADEGDFSSAGAVSIRYLDKLPSAIANLGVGVNGYGRALFANSPAIGDDRILYAFEILHNDGPFKNPDNYNKFNSAMRYVSGADTNKLTVALMGYFGSWNSTDQIPKRKVNDGTMSRWDAIDTTDGGKSHRFSLSVAKQELGDTSAVEWNAYIIKQALDLYSNFTYFMDDPTNGDQFNQVDSRYTTAANWRYTSFGQAMGLEMENAVGVQFQNDVIANGLYKTKSRNRLSTVRSDDIIETSVGVYAQNNTHWVDGFRTTAGVRSDVYQFDVKNDKTANTGNKVDYQISPKLSMIFGPWQQTEFYLNAGGGFHSNDARGTTLTVDPVTGNTIDGNGNAITPVTPLVRSWGYETGARTGIIPNLQSTLNAYVLTMDSELIFVGDAGTTEAGRPSRRIGFEFTNFYAPFPWLTLDADFAYAIARFTDNDAAGNRIPGAAEGVGSLGMSIDHIGPWFGGTHVRYFGPRALTENNSIRSASSILLNGQVGYTINKNLQFALEVFNLLDNQTSAIDYYYQSRTIDEQNPVSDIHFHPIEPRSFRLNATMRL